MEYIRKAGDKAYRKINLFSTNVPNYTNFSHDQQKITINADQVLEVKSDSGEHIFCDRARPEDIYYGVHGRDQVWISCTVNPDVCARIWLQGSGDMRYKLPKTLVPANNKVWITVPDASSGVMLVGDKYFNTAFRLIT